MENIYETYEDLLNGKRKRFPYKFWLNEDSKEIGIKLLKYIVKKQELTDVQIQEITCKQIVSDFKLEGLYRLYDSNLIKLLNDAFPNLEFIMYYNRDSYKKKRSETTKNLSKEKWDNIRYGIRNKRNTPEYREKLSKTKRGELNYIAKLKTPQVIEIRKKWETGNYTTQSLGDTYGVKRQTIADIVYGRTWKHV